MPHPSSAYWSGKVAIVTGASSGFGTNLAAAFSQAGAKVVLAARGAEALEATASALAAHGAETLAVPTDVTDQQSVEQLVATSVECFGRLDVLVNNAGRSARGAVLDTAPREFRDLLELNLIAAVRCVRAAAPHLLETSGHVVNISSLSGKTASRYLGGYAASKFALSAYSQQLRLELEPRGLHVLLVCPGPIARDEPRLQSGTATAGVPESAMRPGGGAKLKAIPPDRLAAAILRACEKRRKELIVPGKARWLFALAQLSPSLGDWIVRRAT